MKTNNHFLGNTAVIMAITVTLLLGSSGCTKNMNDPKGSGGNPSSSEVFIQGSAFTPATLTVSAGTTVTWTNKDGLTHNVTSNTGVFSSGSISNNGTFSFTFNSMGSFPYHCTIHPSMTATVIVN